MTKKDRNEETGAIIQCLMIEEGYLVIGSSYGTYGHSTVSVSVEEVIEKLKKEGIITDGNVIAS